MSIEETNYANDSRNCEPDAEPVFELADGSEVKLPFRWTVCPICRGNGTHVNPSIDAGGLSAEDFAEDPDFAEDYMSGMYDQTCNKCEGKRVVRTVDLKALPNDVRKAYVKHLREEAEYSAMVRAERARGC